jgi:protein CpxP
MKTRTLTGVIGGFGAAALIAIGMATSIPHMSAAQDPGQPPPGRMGRGFGGPGGPGMGRGGRGGPMGLGVDPQDLTDAQREQVKAIHERHADEMRTLMDRNQKAHEALNTAVFAGSGDLRGLAQEVGAVEAEVAFQQAQVESEVLAVLTAEQKQKIAERRAQMEARRTEMQQRRLSRGSKPGNAQ